MKETGFINQHGALQHGGNPSNAVEPQAGRTAEKIQPDRAPEHYGLVGKTSRSLVGPRCSPAPERPSDLPCECASSRCYASVKA